MIRVVCTMVAMEARRYTASDRDACLLLFDSNVPEYFLPQERAEFEAWLGSGPENYFVLEHEGRIVACGGFALPGAGSATASLTWGMVGRQWHRQGVGRFLLMFRMREMSRTGVEIQMVKLETTPQAAPFFAAQGFHPIRVIKDGYAAGLDKVEMVRKMAVCT